MYIAQVKSTIKIPILGGGYIHQNQNVSLTQNPTFLFPGGGWVYIAQVKFTIKTMFQSWEIHYPEPKCHLDPKSNFFISMGMGGLGEGGCTLLNSNLPSKNIFWGGYIAQVKSTSEKSTFQKKIFQSCGGGGGTSPKCNLPLEISTFQKNFLNPGMGGTSPKSNLP